MSKREEIGEYIKNNLKLKHDGSVKFYLYPPDKIIRKIKKYYDRNVSPGCIVAFIDETVMGGGKNGKVFTTTGVYCREMMEKPFYFNYQDISRIDYVSYGGIRITFSNGKDFYIQDVYYDIPSFENVLLTLKEKTSSHGNLNMYSRAAGTVGDKKVNLTDGQRIKCNTIIHGAATAAGAAGAGMAQLFVADAAVITPIQIAMVTALGDIFGFTLTEGLAKGIIKGAMAAAVGRGAVQLLVGWIPGVGNAINTATAAGLTEAIGWMAVTEFYNEQVEMISKDTFDAKFHKQAEEFLNQKKVYDKEIESYEKLLDECSAKIEELENEIKQRDEKNKELEMKLAYYRWHYDQLSKLRAS